MKRPQFGAGGVFIFVLLLLAMVFLAAMFTLSNMSTKVDAQTQTAANLAKAAAALEQFASASGRLPCPAEPDLPSGNANDGVEVFTSPPDSTNCKYGTGVLPWATIGMRRDDAIDAWGWKIFYRVYSGTGGMTQPNGASMVNCDTVQALTMRQPVDSTTKLCPAAHDTVDSDFIAGKGLTVTDFGTTYTGTSASGGAAYVLLSPGPSGFGGYTTSGAQNPNNPSSTDEKNNLKAAGPFVLEAASAPDVGPSDNSHYDDVLRYRTVGDLARKANLTARDWPDTILAGVKFDSTSVGNALGSSPGSGDLGVSSLNFPYATVSAYYSGGTEDLSFVTGSTTGIGAEGGGGSGNNLNSSAGEGIRIDLTQKAQRLAITLGNFGTGYWFFFFPYAEQAQLDFYSGGSTTPVYSTTVQGCKADGGLASFTVDAGTQFDTVKITSVASTLAFQPSSFNIAEFDTCSATGTCITTLDTGSAPTGNHCTP